MTERQTIDVRSLAVAALSLPIRFFRRFLSPLLPPSCRFTPTCSEYALEAIHTHGAIAGGGLAINRICRCHPWGEGGHDPVPEKESGIRPSAQRFDAAGNAECGKTLDHAN